MKQSIVIAALGIAAITGSAQAGGYIAPVVEEVVAAPVIVTAQPGWTGAYVGGTLGYGFNGDDGVGIGQAGVTDSPIPRVGSLDVSGINYGVRGGYRMHMPTASRDWVVGAELAYEGGDISDEFDNTATNGYKGSVDVNNVLSLRVKTGVLNASKDTLFYGIIGASRGDFDYVVEGNGTPGAIDLNENFTKTGYVVGLGVERKMNDRVSLTGEVEYSNFGKTGLVNNGRVTEATPDFLNIKAGLNYQF